MLFWATQILWRPFPLWTPWSTSAFLNGSKSQRNTCVQFRICHFHMFLSNNGSGKWLERVNKMPWVFEAPSNAWRQYWLLQRRCYKDLWRDVCAEANNISGSSSFIESIQWHHHGIIAKIIRELNDIKYTKCFRSMAPGSVWNCLEMNFVSSVLVQHQLVPMCWTSCAMLPVLSSSKDMVSNFGKHTFLFFTSLRYLLITSFLFVGLRSDL